MNIALTWDLFILAFFVIVVAYNFIVGRNKAMKIILGSYLAILAADGFGNLFTKYIGTSPLIEKILRVFSIGGLDKAEISVKIITFVIFVVLMVIKGGFKVHAGDDFHGIIGAIMLLVFGVLSASLMMSAVIVFISGGSFVNMNAIPIDPTLYDFYQSSRFAKILVQHYNVWFVLPAVVFLLTSFMSNPVADDELDD